MWLSYAALVLGAGTLTSSYVIDCSQVMLFHLDRQTRLASVVVLVD